MLTSLLANHFGEVCIHHTIEEMQKRQVTNSVLYHKDLVTNIWGYHNSDATTGGSYLLFILKYLVLAFSKSILSREN